jgi:hypothetical protein
MFERVAKLVKTDRMRPWRLGQALSSRQHVFHEAARPRAHDRLDDGQIVRFEDLAALQLKELHTDKALASRSSSRLPLGACPLLAQGGRSADRVARFCSGRKADMPNQQVECPLMTQSRHLGFRILGAGQRNPTTKHQVLARCAALTAAAFA